MNHLSASFVHEFFTVLALAAPVFLMAAAGSMVRSVGWLRKEADETLFKLNINLLTPCLILDNIVGNPAFERTGNVFVPPLIGFGTVAMGLFVAMAMRSLSQLPDERARRTFGFTTGIYNYGFFPYPLAAALFDRETLGVMFVHNVGVEIAIWTLGVAVVSATDWRKSWRSILNGPVVAIVAALVLNRLGFHPDKDNFLRVTAHTLGQCAIPLGLLQIGGTIAEHVHEFGPKRNPLDLVWSCAIRLLLLPVAFLILAWWLPLSTELKRVMLLQAAMPCAVFPIVMTAKYGGDTVVSIRVVLSTTLVGLVTMPLWIKLGMKWLNLGS